MPPFRVKYASLVTALLLMATGFSDWLEDAGKSELLKYLRVKDLNTLPYGKISVAMVEALEQEHKYMPVVGKGQVTVEEGVFAGKTFINMSGASSAISGHASTVASYYFSRLNSLAPQVNEVSCYDTSFFINDMLAFGDKRVRFTDDKVMSHAWVANIQDQEFTSLYADLIHRYDYLAQAGGSLMVSGLGNGTQTKVPSLWGHAYNDLSVGTTSNNHSGGDTLFSFESNFLRGGRTKPEIVSNGSFTSWATGQVASGGAYIHGYAAHLGHTRITENMEVQKAILLAGATKEEFPNWKNASSDPLGVELRPLDPTYGAGELNIFHSHRIVEGGRPKEGELGYYGWDYGSVGGNPVEYKFRVPAEVKKSSVSIVACWNRTVSEVSEGFLFRQSYKYEPQELADLKIELRREGGGVISESDSKVDNLEHIYLEELTPGTYSLLIKHQNYEDVSECKFGIAWRLNVKDYTTFEQEFRENVINLEHVIPRMRYEVWESNDLKSWIFREEFIPSGSQHKWVAPEQKSTDKFYKLHFWK